MQQVGISCYIFFCLPAHTESIYYKCILSISAPQTLRHGYLSANNYKAGKSFYSFTKNATYFACSAYFSADRCAIISLAFWNTQDLPSVIYGQ